MKDLTWGELAWLVGCVCVGIIIGLVLGGS
jgi:hypothetical protein